MSEKTQRCKTSTGCVKQFVSTSFAQPSEEVQRLSVLPGAISIRSIMSEQASALEYQRLSLSSVSSVDTKRRSPSSAIGVGRWKLVSQDVLSNRALLLEYSVDKTGMTSYLRKQKPWVVTAIRGWVRS